MVVRHVFGAEGHAYVRTYLEANGKFGKLLGPLLLSAHQVDGGVAWAFLPEQIADKRRAPLTDFQSGCLYPSRMDSDECTQSMLDWLRAAVNRVSPPWLVCTEDAYASPSGPYQARHQEPVFYCRDSVYDFQTAASPAPVHTDYFSGATWCPAVSIVTTMQRAIAVRETIDEDAVAALAAAATAIVIGAWDVEGCIVWEPYEATDADMP
jgi:hypothetical protein